ncbi:hypothetical protein TRVA0_008S02872 [Trichomonascus vanleenenianus]|uniref:uncharacterized protein n=1 Tax=Trichomonascus vanleenenianus TaxID=2268995 RepID=UPI003ECA3783
MAYVTVDGKFEYPDDIFPLVPAPFPGLPLAPQDKIAKIRNEYDTFAQMNIRRSALQSPENTQRLFRWARETIDFAESQPGISPELVSDAMAVVKLVAEDESSKFRGAAMYMSGLWSLFGLFGVRRSSSKARELFLSAAKLGYSRALYRIGSDYESRGDTKHAVVYYEHGVKRGDAACFYRMAMAYLRGHLGKQTDVEQGLKLLERSSLISDPDCPQSAYMYGLIQLGELPNVVAQDPQDSVGIAALERSAWLGFAPALIRIGKAWQGGEKGYDAAIAMRYFHLASRQIQYLLFKGDEVPSGDADAGVAEAEISKWFLCGSEGAFSPNEEWAFKFASMAAERSNPIAEFAVGYFYEIGIYVEGDMEQALRWYNLSASHDCSDAAERLKELEGTKTLGRRLTRKDHERSLTLKGRGTMRASRRPVKNEAAEEEQEEPEKATEPQNSAPQKATEPQNSAREEGDRAFDFEIPEKAPQLSPLNINMTEEDRFSARAPPQAHYQQPQAQYQESQAQLQEPQVQYQQPQTAQMENQQVSPLQYAKRVPSDQHRPPQLDLTQAQAAGANAVVIEQNGQSGDITPHLAHQFSSISLRSPSTPTAPLEPAHPPPAPQALRSPYSQPYPSPMNQSPYSPGSSVNQHSPVMSSTPLDSINSNSRASTISSSTSWTSDSSKNSMLQDHPHHHPPPTLRSVSSSVVPSPMSSRPVSSSSANLQIGRPASASVPSAKQPPPLKEMHAPRSPLSEPPFSPQFGLDPPMSPFGVDRAKSRSSVRTQSSRASLSSNRSDASSQPPAKPLGPTPLTFEEMGVPQAPQKDKDCIIM